MAVIVAILIGCLLLMALSVYLFICWQGDENIEVLPGERQPLRCERLDAGQAVFSFVLPICNTGKQDGAVLDAFARALLAEEIFPQGFLTTRLELLQNRRQDGYWAAFFVDQGMRHELIVTLIFTPRDGYGVNDLLKHMVDFNVDIYYVVNSRTSPRCKRAFITLPREEFWAAGEAVAQ